MSDDLTALRELAEKATPGPWEAESTRFGYDAHETPYVTPKTGMYNVAQFYNQGQAADDAAYVAAANPATVLALLDRLERAEAKAKREAEANRMRKPSARAWNSIVERAERAEADAQEWQRVAAEQTRLERDRAEGAEAAIARLKEWLEENRPLRCTIDYASEGEAQDDYSAIMAVLAALDTGKETG